MTKWEYRVELVPHRDGTYSSSIHIHPEDLDALLDACGKDGWELCQMNGSIVVFKRPLVEAN